MSICIASDIVIEMEFNFIEKLGTMRKLINPNSTIQLEPIKPLKLKKVSRYYSKKSTKTKHETFSDGFRDCNKIATTWRNQPNPPKVYVLGYRVHHGLLGSLLGLAGLYYNIPYLTGFGLCGAVDDIDDMDQWLNFEVGENPNYLVDTL